MSKKIYHTLARWRLLLANVQALSEEQRTRLAGAGWNEERLAAAQALIEAYAAADTGHKQSAQTYRVASAAAREVEAELREWYRQATRLVKLAIKQADPANQARLEELLGL